MVFHPQFHRFFTVQVQVFPRKMSCSTVPGFKHLLFSSWYCNLGLCDTANLIKQESSQGRDLGSGIPGPLSSNSGQVPHPRISIKNEGRAVQLILNGLGKSELDSWLK